MFDVERSAIRQESGVRSAKRLHCLSRKVVIGWERVNPRVGSVVSLLLPELPVFTNSFEHGFRGMVQPLSFLLMEMAEDSFTRRWSTQVDVGGFKSHGMEQSEFSTRAAQGREFNARTVRAQAPDNPASAQLDEGIGTSDSTVDDGLVENFGGTFLLFGADAFGPAIRRLDKRFGLAGDASAVPIGEGNVAGMAQAAKSGHAVGEAVSNSGRRHKVFDGINGADWRLSFQSAERVHFLPEANRIAQLAFGNQAQPLMFFAQYKGVALVA